MTEKDRSIPYNWTWVKLEEIVEEVEKVNYQKENPEKEFKYLDISSINNELQKIVDFKEYIGKESPSRARQLIKKNDVLFSTVRTYLKNIAIVPERFDGELASTGFSVIRPREPINYKYLFYYTLTSSFVNPLSNLQRGTSYPAVRQSDVMEQKIPLAPHEEQKRIVKHIEELLSRNESGLKTLKKTQKQLVNYQQSLLKQAFKGRLSEKWRKNNTYSDAKTIVDKIKSSRNIKIQDPTASFLKKLVVSADWLTFWTGLVHSYVNQGQRK
jgi:type I restriction enzyme S subunit